MGLDDDVLPIFRAFLDKSPGVGGAESIIVVEIEPLRVPLCMVRCQPSRDILSRLIRAACLLDQVEAVGPHQFPHHSGPARSVEQLTPEEVEPQLPVRHHSHVAFTRRDGDCVGGEMLELDVVVMKEGPHKAARRRPEPVVMERDEGDDVAFGWARLPMLRRQRDPFWPRRGSEGAEKPLLLQIP